MPDTALLVLLMTGLIILSSCIIYIVHLRKKYIRFTDDVLKNLDALIAGRKISGDDLKYDRETLSSKIDLKMKQLSDVIEHHEQMNTTQREQVQSMVSDISHQLKTPIANMLMYNDTILNNELPREKELECLEIIHTQVEKMDFLLDSLVKMSRLENNILTLNKMDIKLSESINEAVGSVLAKAATKDIGITVKNDDALTINCDPKWTTEAVFNLIDNAVKYTPNGGNVEIATEPLEMYVKVSISDSGIGIREDNINSIFQRFYRENRDRNEDGVGLGLYIARQIITQHGGYLKVSAREDEGSVFAVYLPI